MYLRDRFKLKNSKDFYMVGGMGHTFSVALGYHKNKTICIDGDGSLLYSRDPLETAGDFATKTLNIFLNNNSHDPAGGQNTYANNINFEKLSKV